MSNLSDFLKENSLTTEQVIARSKAIEALSMTDRDQMVARETARRDKKSYEDAGACADKPKSMGRGVSPRTMKLGVDGKLMTRSNRKKVVRAVNSLLVSAKKDAVEWRALFGDVGAQKGKTEDK